MDLKKIKEITNQYKTLGHLVYDTHKDIKDLKSGITKNNEPLEIACMRSISNNIGKYHQIKNKMRKYFLETKGEHGNLQVMPKELEYGMKLSPKAYIQKPKQEQILELV